MIGPRLTSWLGDILTKHDSADEISEIKYLLPNRQIQRKITRSSVRTEPGLSQCSVGNSSVEVE